MKQDTRAEEQVTGVVLLGQADIAGDYKRDQRMSPEERRQLDLELRQKKNGQGGRKIEVENCWASWKTIRANAQ